MSDNQQPPQPPPAPQPPPVVEEDVRPRECRRERFVRRDGYDDLRFTYNDACTVVAVPRAVHHMTQTGVYRIYMDRLQYLQKLMVFHDKEVSAMLQTGHLAFTPQQYLRYQTQRKNITTVLNKAQTQVSTMITEHTQVAHRLVEAFDRAVELTERIIATDKMPYTIENAAAISRHTASHRQATTQMTRFTRAHNTLVAQISNDVLHIQRSIVQLRHTAANRQRQTSSTTHNIADMVTQTFPDTVHVQIRDYVARLFMQQNGHRPAAAADGANAQPPPQPWQAPPPADNVVGAWADVVEQVVRNFTGQEPEIRTAQRDPPEDDGGPAADTSDEVTDLRAQLDRCRREREELQRAHGNVQAMQAEEARLQQRLDEMMRNQNSLQERTAAARERANDIELEMLEMERRRDMAQREFETSQSTVAGLTTEVMATDDDRPPPPPPPPPSGAGDVIRDTLRRASGDVESSLSPSLREDLTQRIANLTRLLVARLRIEQGEMIRILVDSVTTTNGVSSATLETMLNEHFPDAATDAVGGTMSAELDVMRAIIEGGQFTQGIGRDMLELRVFVVLLNCMRMYDRFILNRLSAHIRDSMSAHGHNIDSEVTDVDTVTDWLIDEWILLRRRGDDCDRLTAERDKALAQLRDREQALRAITEQLSARGGGRSDQMVLYDGIVSSPISVTVEDTTGRDVSDLLAERNVLQRQVAECRVELESANRRMADMVNDHATANEARLRELHESSEQLAKTVAECTALRQSTYKMTRLVTDLENSQDQSRQEMDTLRVEYATLVEKLATLRNEYDNVSSQLQACNERVNARDDTARAGFETALQQQQQAADEALVTARADLATQLADVTQEAHQLRARLEDALTQLKNHTETAAAAAHATKRQRISSDDDSDSPPSATKRQRSSSDSPLTAPPTKCHTVDAAEPHATKCKTFNAVVEELLATPPPPCVSERVKSLLRVAARTASTTCIQKSIMRRMLFAVELQCDSATPLQAMSKSDLDVLTRAVTSVLDSMPQRPPAAAAANTSQLERVDSAVRQRVLAQCGMRVAQTLFHDIDAATPEVDSAQSSLMLEVDSAQSSLMLVPSDSLAAMDSRGRRSLTIIGVYHTLAYGHVTQQRHMGDLIYMLTPCTRDEVDGMMGLTQWNQRHTQLVVYTVLVSRLAGTGHMVVFPNSTSVTVDTLKANLIQLLNDDVYSGRVTDFMRRTRSDSQERAMHVHSLMPYLIHHTDPEMHSALVSYLRSVDVVQSPSTDEGDGVYLGDLVKHLRETAGELPPSAVGVNTGVAELYTTYIGRLRALLPVARPDALRPDTQQQNILDSDDDMSAKITSYSDEICLDTSAGCTDDVHPTLHSGRAVTVDDIRKIYSRLEPNDTWKLVDAYSEQTDALNARLLSESNALGQTEDGDHMTLAIRMLRQDLVRKNINTTTLMDQLWTATRDMLRDNGDVVADDRRPTATDGDWEPPTQSVTLGANCDWWRRIMECDTYERMQHMERTFEHVLFLLSSLIGVNGYCALWNIVAGLSDDTDITLAALVTWTFLMAVDTVHRHRSYTARVSANQSKSHVYLWNMYTARKLTIVCRNIRRSLALVKANGARRVSDGCVKALLHVIDMGTNALAPTSVGAKTLRIARISAAMLDGYTLHMVGREAGVTSDADREQLLQACARYDKMIEGVQVSQDIILKSDCVYRR